MKIEKAVITAAGYGTRFLPVTKTIQKEMMPVLNKPLVDYVVDDCIKAGIKEIYGSATPVKLVQDQVINEEAFLVFMGDDFSFNADGSSEASKMIELFSKTDSLALATFIERPKELLN